jgi:hypothetical protein
MTIGSSTARAASSASCVASIFRGVAGIQAPSTGPILQRVLVVGCVCRRRLRRERDGRPILELRIRRSRRRAFCRVRIRGAAALAALRICRRGTRVACGGVWLRGAMWVLRARTVVLESAPTTGKSEPCASS